jgi:asparagine synthase (glutamine-hydrolysing)
VCGVVGLWSPGRRAAVRSAVIMTSALAHRGPDDSGVESVGLGECVLGHRRLSILDLSALGHQPMASPDRRCWIVFNGEVYNFREIRAELARCGQTFVSDSDTEVVLAAYREWGVRAVERFRGMFAFAIWDEDSQTLHLCRDRFGVKPLFFCLSGGQLAFASEIKALHAARLTGSSVDSVALAEYIQYGYATAPRTLFAAVRSLRPGTILSFGRDLHPREREFWSVHALFDRAQMGNLVRELASLPDEALLDRVDESLGEAFEYRMVADVPVGLFLSGGIDSSIVAAVLSRRTGTQLRTFTVGYGNSEFDETKYARQVASHLGAAHTEFIVSSEEMLGALERVIDIADEPIGDSSLIPTLVVSDLAHRHVKVALSADGADELFGGYARYQICGSYVDQIGSPLRAGHWLAGSVLDQLPAAWIQKAYAMVKGRGERFAAINDKLRKFTAMSRSGNPFDAYDSAVSEWGASARDRFGIRSASAEAGARETFERGAFADARDGFMHFDAARYLPGDLLTKVDRASMAVSLEAREPFLDHEMARVAVALPIRWKMRGKQSKYVLRRLLDRHFPIGWFDRPKHGFSAPVADWLKGPLRSAVRSELSADRVREFGLLDAGAVDRAVSDFFAEKRTSSAAGIWFLLQLQRWAGRWLAAPPRTPEELENDQRAAAGSGAAATASDSRE